MTRFTHAILKTPAPNFAQGLTTSGLGQPDYVLTLEQHRNYQALLRNAGLAVRILDPDPAYPDSTFVEDTAVLIPDCAILARPGAPSRRGEASSMESTLKEYFPEITRIAPPGTLDGGDICDADGHFFIGVSERTNQAGAQQLTDILARHGLSSTQVDITRMDGLLHLKSGLAYLGEGLLVLDPLLAGHPAFTEYRRLLVDAGERYAANCIRVNDLVLVASGFPHFSAALEEEGCHPAPLDMSEFRKMDGGLSCLSLRF